MDLTFSAGQNELREQIREWLHEHVPTEAPPDAPLSAVRTFDAEWQREQFDGGWAGIAWPQAFGGRGLGLTEQLIWYEEYARARAPYIRSCFVSINHAGPTLILRGSDEIKSRHLPAMLSGEEIWCQGFSEPSAGSDLANVQTRGTVVDDRLVVNGQKIWTSHANIADFQELLVRTDPTAPRHQGLSWVVCNMRSEGIEVRTIESIDGGTELCEVFYSDVRIPLDNVVGGINNGWDVAMTTLSFERGTAFMAEQVTLAEMVEELIEVATARALGGTTGRPAIHDEEFARRLGMLRAEVAALRAMTYMGVSRNAHRVRPGPEGSFLRLAVGELMQRITQVAIDLLGVESLVWTPALRHRSNWSNDYLYSLSRTISAGTKDIQRNIIGERLLGLPRS